MGELAKWWAKIAFTGSDLIATFALLVAVGSLWVSWHYGRPQRALAQRQLREKDLADAEAKSAMIVCRLVGPDPARMRMYFGNSGQADARNVTVDLGGDEASAALFGDQLQDFPGERIRPHGSVSVPVSIYYGGPDRYVFNVSWDDNSGTRKTEQQSVSPHG